MLCGAGFAIIAVGMKRNWFFDFDGTLCATEEDIVNAWRATIRELGLDLAPFEELYSTGPSLDDIVRLVWPELADRWMRKHTGP